MQESFAAIIYVYVLLFLIWFVTANIQQHWVVYALPRIGITLANLHNRNLLQQHKLLLPRGIYPQLTIINLSIFALFSWIFLLPFDVCCHPCCLDEGQKMCDVVV